MIDSFVSKKGKDFVAVKKILCLLLTLAFLFSFAACTPAEGETTGEAENTTTEATPAENTAPDEATEPEETELEPVTTPAETPESEPTLDNTKFPTITSVKIRENDFTVQNPTDEELTNFLCEAFLYETMLYRGYACVYAIPVVDGYVPLNDGYGGYQLDPAYVKDITYIRSVLSSYLKSSDDPIGYFFDKDGEPDNNVYVGEKYGHGSCDPALINIVEREDQDNIIYATVKVYVCYDALDEFECRIDTYKLQLIYEGGRWKLDADTIFDDAVHTRISSPPRDDFGKRLTIEKAD